MIETLTNAEVAANAAPAQVVRFLNAASLRTALFAAGAVVAGANVKADEGLRAAAKAGRETLRKTFRGLARHFADAGIAEPPASLAMAIILTATPDAIEAFQAAAADESRIKPLAEAWSKAKSEVARESMPDADLGTKDAARLLKSWTSTDKRGGKSIAYVRAFLDRLNDAIDALPADVDRF